MPKEVTRSYTRKVQLEHLGGNKYESVDLFASYKQLEIPDDTTDEQLKKISDDLYLKSVADVEGEIKNIEKVINWKEHETQEEFLTRLSKREGVNRS